MFIVIEGPDAVGKKTQTELIVERCKVELAQHVLHYTFPRYDSELGQAILRHLQDDTKANSIDEAFKLQCMMTADRYAVAPAIKKLRAYNSTIVVVDRWWQSGYVYGMADGLNGRWLVQIHATLPDPDLNILIKLPHEAALRRRPELRDRYERDAVKQARVRDNYAMLWDGEADDKETGSQWVTVDGDATVPVVHERIWQHVLRCWNER